MKQCWKCRSTVGENNIHHIDGNPENEKPQNLLRLCVKCHDLVQGICDKCINQKDCFVQKLQQCWAFDDALPPIYFRERVSIPSNLVPMCQSKATEAENVLKSHFQTIDPSQLVPCIVCGRDVSKERTDRKKEVICPYCVLLLVKNPRRKDSTGPEKLDQWKERLLL